MVTQLSKASIQKELKPHCTGPTLWPKKPMISFPLFFLLFCAWRKEGLVGLEDRSVKREAAETNQMMENW